MESKPQREILIRWLLALGGFTTLIFFFSPMWGAFRLWSRIPETSGMIEVRRGAAVLAQIDHPGAAIADQLHAAIQWRLLFPVIGRVLHLSPAIFFALADVGCVLVLAFMITVLRRRGASFGFATQGAIILGAGSWFFTSVCWLGYFDAWVVLGLLFVAFAEASWPVWLACFWVPWVDERFVLGLPLALLCRWVQCTAAGKPLDLKREFALPGGLALAFVIVRLGALGGKSSPGATVGGYLSGLDTGGATGARVAFGIWEGLRVGWLGVVAALLFVTRVRAVWLGAAVVVLVAVGIGTAQDYSRAMMFVSPVALLGAVLAAGRRAGYPRWVPGAAMVLALVLPAHHVMSNWVNPIYYFYHELAALHAPPRAMMPEVLELRAIEAMERGEFANALENLNQAIRLADNPASPSRRRGMLEVTAGRWAEAKRDFSVVIEHEPDQPDGWFLRAQVELATGDAAAARADVEQARAHAPAGWANRPDVARVLAALDQAGGGR